MSGRKVQWERMFPDELEEGFKECPIVYLPYGLCEPHGWHNAVGLDAIRAHECCIHAAQVHGGIVAPPYYWHCHEISGYGSWGHAKINQERTWLTAIPPWMFLKSMCYHIRAVDALGFQGAILFSGHSGPHHQDVPIVIDIMQQHVGVRLYSLMGIGLNRDDFEDGKGMGGHAGRGETSALWAVAPDCVDMSRMPEDDTRKPDFAMGDYNESSSRLVGEKMVEGIIEHFGDKTEKLLIEHQNEGANTTPLTFDDVEGIWEEEIRPKLTDFASMQPPNPEPPKDSQWHANSRIPKGRIL
ncbi:creatininase family protein [Candidatus Poribacteria bacterium]|nr:creatininase family protein [Candidatus Poribacteria bacterium]